MPETDTSKARSLDDLANEIDQKGRLLASEFNKLQILNIKPSKGKYTPSDYYEIRYSVNKGFECDWPTLQKKMATLFETIKADIYIHVPEEQVRLQPSQEQAEEIAVKTELLIRPGARIRDPYRKQELILEGIIKLTEFVKQYQQDHPEAVKREYREPVNGKILTNN